MGDTDKKKIRRQLLSAAKRDALLEQLRSFIDLARDQGASDGEIADHLEWAAVHARAGLRIDQAKLDVVLRIDEEAHETGGDVQRERARALMSDVLAENAGSRAAQYPRAALRTAISKAGAQRDDRQAVLDSMSDDDVKAFVRALEGTPAVQRIRASLAADAVVNDLICLELFGVHRDALHPVLDEKGIRALDLVIEKVRIALDDACPDPGNACPDPGDASPNPGNGTH